MYVLDRFRAISFGGTNKMPWMDTPRSNFISGLEHFWNSWASWRSDIKLIVCGSATSWIINNLIKNRGGLHNRITHKTQSMGRLAKLRPISIIDYLKNQQLFVSLFWT